MLTTERSGDRVSQAQKYSHFFQEVALEHVPLDLKHPNLPNMHNNSDHASRLRCRVTVFQKFHYEEVALKQ